MKELTTKLGNGNPPDTCSAQVRAFLETSARYLGLTRDVCTSVTPAQRLSEVPAPLACACRNVESQLLENRL
jgi:hypothetical protein